MKEDHMKQKGMCPICNNDLMTLSLLCDHFSDTHRDKKTNPNCYDDNMDMFISLYEAKMHESGDSNTDIEKCDK